MTFQCVYLYFLDERIYIQVKTYNSYCVEKLWVGNRGRRIEEFGPDEVQTLQKYLFDHGLDVPSFNSLIRGQYQTRHFLPSGGQILKGKVKRLMYDTNTKEATVTRITIEAEVGDLLFIEATRESVYIHGHWMGKADLSYVLEVGKSIREIYGNLVLRVLKLNKYTFIYVYMRPPSYNIFSIF